MNGDDFDKLLRFVRQIQRDYASTQKLITDAQGGLAYGALQKSLEDWQSSIAIAEKLAQNPSAFHELAERTSRQFEAFQQNIGPLADRIRRDVARGEEQVHSRAIEKLRTTGWVGLETVLTYWDLDVLAQQPVDSLDDYICKLFAADEQQRLVEMVDSWMDVPYLLVRNELLDQCVVAHERRLWGAVIPGLLPLLDGLSAEIARVPGMMTDPEAGKLIKVSAVISEYRSEDVPEDLAGQWTTLVVDFVRTQVFAESSFKTDPPPPNPFNRHWILHGRVPAYWSEANSLRAFLLVHVLAQVARLAPESQQGPDTGGVDKG